MTIASIPLTDWLQIALFFTVLLALAAPLGHYMANVFDDKTTYLRLVEKSIYWLCGINADQRMCWQSYLQATLLFSALCFGAMYVMLELQPFPQVSSDLAFMSAAAFITGTNWQPHVPETTVTTINQHLGLAVQSFLTAAIGLAVMAAFIRGLFQTKTENIGNFWVDAVRATLYLLLPACFLFAVFLVSQGVVQTFEATTITSPFASDLSQTIMTGPVASQVAIKQLGTNGGGYFLANGAHPFENPTPLSNFLQMITLLLIPVASVFCFGRMVDEPKQGRVLLATMFIIFIPFFLVVLFAEQGGNPLFTQFGIDQTLGNMEGKELRFGSTSSALWSALTTATSTGSTNAALDSFMPLSTLSLLILMEFGEIIFGGIGSGLYGMLIYVLLAVFIAGLMTGRTPEYLGKKISVFEVKMASLILLIPALCTLFGTAIAVMFEAGHSGATNPGPQGFTQIFFAVTSASNNNGSALAGIQANTPFYNILLGTLMLISRFGVITAVLAVAGSLSSKVRLPKTRGSLNTASATFVIALVGILFLLGIPSYIPALLLGPVAEHIALPMAGSM